MASPAYEQILVIQALDLTIRQLRHRIDTHPARKEVAEVQGRLADHEAAAAEVEERRHGLERQQKRLEDEVATIEDKRRSVDGKLYGGEVTGSKELLALQDEASLLLDRQRGLEDEQLELMEALESVGEELAVHEGQRGELRAELAAHEAELAAATAELEGELQGVEAERTAAAAQSNAELLASYERLRGQFDGVAVARLVDGRCDGCHIQLSAMAVDQLSKMAEGAVVTCEECGRLLVR